MSYALLQITSLTYFYESGVEAVLSKACKIGGHFRHSPENDVEIQTDKASSTRNLSL